MLQKNRLFLLLLTALVCSCSQPGHPLYLNPDAPTDKRVEDLLSRMSIEEKASQLLYNSPAIERLGIPAYNWWNECLHGVARAGKATVFPQAIGMAATWDRRLIFEMADVTSTEARAKYNDFVSRDKRGIYQGLTFWSPNINLFRDPRWGRGMETYGEDPYLTGELACSFIEGIQGNDPNYLKAVATAKHFVVHSGPESSRHRFNAEISERDFRDSYLPAFKKTVQEGGVGSVMCAYNRFRGQACCGSDSLLNELLRDELGFKGYIVSDCGALYDFYTGHEIVPGPVAAAALGLQSGTDLNCGDVYTHIIEAVNEGLLTEEDIDRAVRRLFTARMQLGMFDPQDRVPYSRITIDTVSCHTHRMLAERMARESIVLLQNKAQVLPLSAVNRKIAVIGPNAAEAQVMLGNYNGTPVDPVTPLEGIIRYVDGRSEVRYAQGVKLAEEVPYFETIPISRLFTGTGLEENGIVARYYKGFNTDSTVFAERPEQQAERLWLDDELPEEGLSNDEYSVSWTAELVPEKSGQYQLGLYAKFGELYLDGKLLTRIENIHSPMTGSAEVQLNAGQAYHILVKMYDRHCEAPCRLVWSKPDAPERTKALELARWADEIILFMGLSPNLEGEEMKVDVEGFSGGDRQSLELPKVQQELIAALSDMNKPTVLVLLNGSALALGEEEQQVSSILEAWYPGEAGGTAIAEVLFGAYNPAGRLPVTFYRSADDLPSFEDYAMAGRTYRYFDGEVLYPFGYGLSYSSFSYTNFELKDDTIVAGSYVVATIEVMNTGETDGEEVIQLYLKEDAGQPDLKPELKGFERVFIPAGEKRKVTISIPAKELSRFDETSRDYRIKPGSYTVYSGPSSAPAGLQARKLYIQD